MEMSVIHHQLPFVVITIESPVALNSASLTDNLMLSSHFPISEMQEISVEENIIRSDNANDFFILEISRFFVLGTGITVD